MGFELLFPWKNFRVVLCPKTQEKLVKEASFIMRFMTHNCLMESHSDESEKITFLVVSTSCLSIKNPFIKTRSQGSFGRRRQCERKSLQNMLVQASTFQILLRSSQLGDLWLELHETAVFLSDEVSSPKIDFSVALPAATDVDGDIGSENYQSGKTS